VLETSPDYEARKSSFGLMGFAVEQALRGEAATEPPVASVVRRALEKEDEVKFFSKVLEMQVKGEMLHLENIREAQEKCYVVNATYTNDMGKSCSLWLVPPYSFYVAFAPTANGTTRKFTSLMKLYQSMMGWYVKILTDGDRSRAKRCDIRAEVFELFVRYGLAASAQVASDQAESWEPPLTEGCDESLSKIRSGFPVLAVPEVKVPVFGYRAAECTTQQEMEAAALQWRCHLTSRYGCVPFQPPNRNNTGCDVVHVDGSTVRLYELKASDSEKDAEFALGGKAMMSLLGLWDCVVREVFAVPVTTVELVFVVATRHRAASKQPLAVAAETDRTTVQHKRLALLCPAAPWGIAGWTITKESGGEHAPAVIAMNPRRSEAGKPPCVVRTLGELWKFLTAAGIKLSSPRFVTSESEIFQMMTPTVAALLPDMDKILHENEDMRTITKENPNGSVDDSAAP
jgi:hypothetical protein